MAKKKAVTALPEGDKEAHERRLSKSLPVIGTTPLKVKCKNKRQKELITSIREKDITIISGPAGTGKSFISLYAALDLIKTYPSEYKKLVLVYPVEHDDSEAIGMLPGTLNEKLLPYRRPDFYTIEKILNESTGKDNGGALVEEMEQKGLIEVMSTTFLRGMTLDNCIIIISEAQNLSADATLKVLTRIGENCKLIISGDSFQVSAKSIKKGRNASGLGTAVEKLMNIPEIGVVEFLATDIVRNPLISKILYAWDPETYSYLSEAPGIKDEDISVENDG